MTTKPTVTAERDNRNRLTVRIEGDGFRLSIQQRRRELYVRRSDLTKAPRVYVWADDKFDVMEDLANRTRRPYTVWRKEVRRIFAMLSEQGIVDLDVTAMGWSQYAGCSCPCSPGFVLKARPGVHFVSPEQTTGCEWLTNGYDVYVTLTGKDVPTVDETLAPRFEMEGV